MLHQSSVWIPHLSDWEETPLLKSFPFSRDMPKASVRKKGLKKYVKFRYSIVNQTNSGIWCALPSKMAESILVLPTC